MLSMVFKITLFRFFFLFRGGKTVKYPGSLQITKASNMVLNTKLKSSVSHQDSSKSSSRKVKLHHQNLAEDGNLCAFVIAALPSVTSVS